MNSASAQALVQIARIEEQQAAIKKFIAAQKKKAKAGRITDWGETGDLGRIRTVLEETMSIVS